LPRNTDSDKRCDSGIAMEAYQYGRMSATGGDNNDDDDDDNAKAWSSTVVDRRDDEEEEDGLFTLSEDGRSTRSYFQ